MNTVFDNLPKRVRYPDGVVLNLHWGPSGAPPGETRAMVFQGYKQVGILYRRGLVGDWYALAEGQELPVRVFLFSSLRDVFAGVMTRQREPLNEFGL